MLTWLDARNASGFGDLSWSDNTLSFSISVAPAAQNLMAMLPMLAASRLTGLIHEGVYVPFRTETIKGMEYAFSARNANRYAAIYNRSLALGPVQGARAAAGSAVSRLPAQGNFNAAIDIPMANRRSHSCRLRSYALLPLTRSSAFACSPPL
jgi:hypothetical protein